VVAGSRTQSTYPIMANDPHRTIAAPSLRYWVHLVAPGWNVIGGGEPVLPGVSIGHNGHGAWGLTIFGNDNEDLYVYEINPANPDEYRYQGRWERMRTVEDTIAVKGEQPERVTLKYTRHGPVIFEDRTARRAYALRAAWLEPGGAPYLASLRMNQARTWEEFREACRYNHMPAENMVWADRTGTIGWQAAGIQPLRRNWSGLLPVPATAATNGTATCRSRISRTKSIRREGSSPPRTITSFPTTTRGRKRCTTRGPIRIAPRASTRFWVPGASSASPKPPRCRTTTCPSRRARSCRCCAMSRWRAAAPPGARRVGRMGFRHGQELGRGRHLRHVAAAPAREHA
jgi:hypothetical protein